MLSCLLHAFALCGHHPFIPSYCHRFLARTWAPERSTLFILVLLYHSIHTSLSQKVKYDPCPRPVSPYCFTHTINSIYLTLPCYTLVLPFVLSTAVAPGPGARARARRGPPLCDSQSPGSPECPVRRTLPLQLGTDAFLRRGLLHGPSGLVGV